MSAAAARFREAWVDPRLSSPALEQEPKKGEEPAPTDEREGEDRSQPTSAANQGLDLTYTVALWCIGVSQLAWVSALAYLAFRFLT